MKISQKRRDELYGAIHNEVLKIRMQLQLPANKDWRLAQVEHEIWAQQKRVLGIINDV
jgi:hypothetical protein